MAGAGLSTYMYVDSLNCLMWVLRQNLSKWPKVSEQLVRGGIGIQAVGLKVCAHGHVRYCQKNRNIEEKASSRSLDAHSATLDFKACRNSGAQEKLGNNRCREWKMPEAEATLCSSHSTPNPHAKNQTTFYST